MKMTKSKMKKLLQNCHVDVDFSLQHYSWGSLIKGSLAVVENNESKLQVVVKAQANYTKDFIPTKMRFKHIMGMEHGFYGAQAETKVSMSGHSHSPYERVDYAEAFFAVINEIIEETNLGYKYPDCEFSKIIGALETLGCRVHDLNGHGLEAA